MKFFEFLKRFAFSPFFFTAFLGLPLVLLCQRLLHLPLLNPLFVIVNIILFALYLTVLVVLRTKRWGRVLRYGEKNVPRLTPVTLGQDGEQVRTTLRQAGYRFTTTGTYGERRDTGYGGGTIFLAGLLLLLLIGSYDNLRQFSGVMLFGVGQPAKLYEKGSFYELTAGLLSRAEKIPYQLQIRRQYPLSSEFPRGGSDVAVLDRSGKEVGNGLLIPGKGLSVGDFDFFMTKLVTEVWVVVTTTENMDFISQWVKLYPDDQAPKGYTHSGVLEDDFFKVDGKVWFDTASERMRIEARRDGATIIDVVLEKELGYKLEQGGYRTVINGIGKWTEIHVTRQRHKGLMFLALLCAAGGGLVRLLVRPRRVWIEDQGERCIVRGTDKAMLHLVSGIQ